MSRSPSKLSTTSYVTLGILAVRGPSTSYDLKRAIAKSVGYFWPFPHAQLYSEPVRLTQRGLLVQEQEEDGRRRRFYRITAAGKEVLRTWLRQPVKEIIQFRDIAQLKLFFGELVEPDDLRALAESQLELHRQRLVEYQAIARKHEKDRGLAARMAPLDLGLRLERASLAFWEQIRKTPPQVAE
jgi:PadR family transcriptional regulator, regulatory protein AphA